MVDGHLNKCKECTKKDVKDRRRNDPKVQEYDRKRGNRQKPSYLKQYREKFPRKYLAHTLIKKAVKDGTIFKAINCEQCSSDFAIEGHHDDYAKPLEVRWLCSACHKQWHAVHGEGLNG